jgi:hypothetical protein
LPALIDKREQIAARTVGLD